MEIDFSAGHYFFATDYLFDVCFRYIYKRVFCKRKGGKMDADWILIHKIRTGDEAAIDAFVRKYLHIQEKIGGNDLNIGDLHVLMSPLFLMQIS